MRWCHFCWRVYCTVYERLSGLVNSCITELDRKGVRLSDRVAECGVLHLFLGKEPLTELLPKHQTFLLPVNENVTCNKSVHCISDPMWLKYNECTTDILKMLSSNLEADCPQNDSPHWNGILAKVYYCWTLIYYTTVLINTHYLHTSAGQHHFWKSFLTCKTIYHGWILAYSTYNNLWNSD